jgi:hypothetical protein
MFLWGWNPTGDDAPPLQLILGRDRYPPLPTCKLYDHDIEMAKILPLTRANQFLNSITSFTGVVERFDHPDVTLYYTLTRNAFAHADSHNATLHKPGEHALYITIFDHKERVNTRVYTQRSGVDHFYATESSLPVIDPKQGLLEIKLGDNINNQDDPIISNQDIRSTLITHYQSIMDQLYFAMRRSHRDPTYTIENQWTMAMGHTKSAPQTRSGEGQMTEANTDASTFSLRDFRYLQHGRLEKICQSLCSARGEWIATYTHWGIREMRERFMFQGTRMASHVDEAPTGRAKAEGKRRMLADETETWESPPLVRSDQEDIESQVIDQIRRMELLLVQEMQIWEEHLLDEAVKLIRRRDVLEKARLRKEWKRGFRTRLDTDIRAMEARFDSAELEVKASHNDELTRKWQSTHDHIRKAWQALAEKRTTSSPPTKPSHLERLHTKYQKSARDVEAIIGWSQLTAAQREQLLQQSEVVSGSTIELKEAMFWMDDTHGLTKYKLSQSKWLGLDMRSFTQPLEVYMYALRAMSDLIFVRFDHVDSDDDYRSIAELIRHLPSSVTSIDVPFSHLLPAIAIQRDTPLFVKDSKNPNKIETFLHNNQSLLARTRHIHVFIDPGSPSVRPAQLELRRGSKIAVSFFGPPSGNLILQLTHSSRDTAVTLTLQESHGSTRTFQYPVPSSLTVTNITLSSSPSDHPSIVPNTPNNLIIEVTGTFNPSLVS